MIMQIIVDLLQIFAMVYKTIQRVFVSNSELFGAKKAELWAKEVEQFFIMLYEKMRSWAFFCPPTRLPQYKCIEGFRILINRT